METTDVDDKAAEAFAGRVFEMLTDSALSYLIHIGHTTGLLTAAAEYSAESETFWLPREHAASLIGDGVANLAPVALLTTMLGQHVDEVARAFRTGGGVPWAAFVPEIRDVMDALWQPPDARRGGIRRRRGARCPGRSRQRHLRRHPRGA